MTMSKKVGRGIRALGVPLIVLFGITQAHAQPAEMAQVRSAGEVNFAG